jgi:hypothetical protein
VAHNHAFSAPITSPRAIAHHCVSRLPCALSFSFRFCSPALLRCVPLLRALSWRRTPNPFGHRFSRLLAWPVVRLRPSAGRGQGPGHTAPAFVCRSIRMRQVASSEGTSGGGDQGIAARGCPVLSFASCNRPASSGPSTARTDSGNGGKDKHSGSVAQARSDGHHSSKFVPCIHLKGSRCVAPRIPEPHSNLSSVPLFLPSAE